ncbi:MAG: U32 family peptidase [Methanotrichaceae archaeon]|nr:U32 family peptidase [Methanotrichaceae archaeon]
MSGLPELLSPAGSPLALKAAVAAGADAVYLSGKRFGARKLADNFNKSQLKQALDYAHLRDVKVYVTVNTLIREDELAEVAEYFLELYEIGVDALLIQDVGAASLARFLVPELDLHASTQMTIHNQEGLAWAAKMGFKRVVLAREVSLKEIDAMQQVSGLGLEVFIHGALCYCYSGQCFISSAIGGRSGNRGLCAQPCRKPYLLIHGEKDEYGRPIDLKTIPIKNHFLISTKDLSVYWHLDKIVRSTIASLKIEGRMKSPEYVAIVTSIYRKALDSIAQGNWQPSEDDARDLSLAFNRDFTDGYILGSRQIMGREMSQNRGLLIGTVASFDSTEREASIKLINSWFPEEGDGLVVISTDRKFGLIVHRPIRKAEFLKIKTPDKAIIGAAVYQTNSKSLSRKAGQIISQERICIPIDLEISWKDGNVLVEGSIERVEMCRKFRFESDFKMEHAIRKPLTEERIMAQIRKTGGTLFYVRRLKMDYPGGFFAPISAINRFRRSILARAEEAILQDHCPSSLKVETAKQKLKSIDFCSSVPQTNSIPTLAMYADSLETVEGAAKAGCDRIYLEPAIGNRYGRARKISDMLEEAKSLCKRSQLIWKWPKITKDSFLHSACTLVRRAEIDGIMVEGLGAAEAILSIRPDAKIFGSTGLNIWNHFTVWHFASYFQLLTLSPELSTDQLSMLIARSRTMLSPKFELIVQGNQEVMITEDCIACLAPGNSDFYGLQDVKRLFPISTDDDGRTHIFNSVETCLLDYLPILFNIGLDGLAIDARNRTKRYAEETAMVYIEAIKLIERKNGSFENHLRVLKHKIQPMVIGGLTTGHLIKGRKEYPC